MNGKKRKSGTHSHDNDSASYETFCNITYEIHVVPIHALDYSCGHKDNFNVQSPLIFALEKSIWSPAIER